MWPGREFGDARGVRVDGGVSGARRRRRRLKGVVRARGRSAIASPPGPRSRQRGRRHEEPAGAAGRSGTGSGRFVSAAKRPPWFKRRQVPPARSPRREHGRAVAAVDRGSARGGRSGTRRGSQPQRGGPPARAVEEDQRHIGRTGLHGPRPSSPRRTRTVTQNPGGARPRLRSGRPRNAGTRGGSRRGAQDTRRRFGRPSCRRPCEVVGDLPARGCCGALGLPAGGRAVELEPVAPEHGVELVEVARGRAHPTRSRGGWRRRAARGDG